MDPEQITENETPLIVFSDMTSGLVEFFIKMRTKGDYNHVMWLNRPGFLASQGNTYSEVPLSRYMKKNNRLKFYEIIGLTVVQKRLIQEHIKKKLAKPFWAKWYDWLAIAGQATGIKKLNVPWLDICSEDVPEAVKYMAKKALDSESLVYKVLMGIPAHESPQGLNDYFKKYPEVFRVYGKWEADNETASVAVGEKVTSPVPG